MVLGLQDPYYGGGAPAVLRRNYAARFREQGYTIVRSVFTPGEMDELAAAVDRIYACAIRHEAGPPAVPGHPEVGFRTVEDRRLGRICRIATWPAYLDPVLARIRIDPD